MSKFARHKQVGVIDPSCYCTDVVCQPATPPPPPTGTGGTGTGISIYNNFYPINNDQNIIQSPVDGGVTQPPPTGTGGGGTTIQPQPLPEPPTQNGDGTTAVLPPTDASGTPIATTTSPFPWFILLALGYAGYQVLKPGKQERTKHRKPTKKKK